MFFYGSCQQSLGSVKSLLYRKVSESSKHSAEDSFHSLDATESVADVSSAMEISINDTLDAADSSSVAVRRDSSASVEGIKPFKKGEEEGTKSEVPVALKVTC